MISIRVLGFLDRVARWLRSFVSRLQGEYAQLCVEHALMERLAVCDSLTRYGTGGAGTQCWRV